MRKKVFKDGRLTGRREIYRFHTGSINDLVIRVHEVSRTTKLLKVVVAAFAVISLGAVGGFLGWYFLDNDNAPGINMNEKIKKVVKESAKATALTQDDGILAVIKESTNTNKYLNDTFLKKSALTDFVKNTAYTSLTTGTGRLSQISLEGKYVQKTVVGTTVMILLQVD